MKYIADTKKGFTIIELLVVVAIIAMLSSIVFIYLTDTQMKARDSLRIQHAKQIEHALELYYTQHGRYPARDTGSTSEDACGGVPSYGNARWCSLFTDLEPYLDPLPIDPRGPQPTYRYYYDSDSGDSYQSYGFMITFEHPLNQGLSENDGGFYETRYEFGQQPAYCIQRYSGTNSNWWGSQATVCVGGN